MRVDLPSSTLPQVSRRNSSFFWCCARSASMSRAMRSASGSTGRAGAGRKLGTILGVGWGAALVDVFAAAFDDGLGAAFADLDPGFADDLTAGLGTDLSAGFLADLLAALA